MKKWSLLMMVGAVCAASVSMYSNIATAADSDSNKLYFYNWSRIHH